jgi:aspartyl-tRNA(Asn)/glutamyl-tRNA(Gln) amidotransferase subunit C
VSFDAADVARLAALAQLDLSPAEAHRLAAELSTILEHVAELRSAELRASTPVHGMAEACAPPRADEPRQVALDDAASLSPHAVDGFFTVPRGAAREP